MTMMQAHSKAVDAASEVKATKVASKSSGGLPTSFAATFLKFLLKLTKVEAPSTFFRACQTPGHLIFGVQKWAIWRFFWPGKTPWACPKVWHPTVLVPQHAPRYYAVLAGIKIILSTVDI